MSPRSLGEEESKESPGTLLLSAHTPALALRYSLTMFYLFLSSLPILQVKKQKYGRLGEKALPQPLLQAPSCFCRQSPTEVEPGLAASVYLSSGGW
jgi:hypothetical protein